MGDEAIWRESDAKPTEGLAAVTLTMPQIKAMMEQHAHAGWIWDERTYRLADPADAELYYWIDPISRRVILSAKLIERIGIPYGTGPKGRPS
jgi:hypothetical protein